MRHFKFLRRPFPTLARFRALEPALATLRPLQAPASGTPFGPRAWGGVLRLAACVWVACTSTFARGGPAGSHAPSTLVVSNQELSAGDSLHYSFTLLRSTAETCPVLELDVRLKAATFAGSNTALAIAINGNVLAEDRLINKPLLYAQVNGVLATWADGTRWRAVYSPDFDPRRNSTDQVHRVLGVDPYHLTLRIDDLVHAGANELTFVHIGARLPNLELAQVSVGRIPCPAPAAGTSVAATTLSVADSLPRAPSALASLSAEGAIHVSAGVSAFDVETEVSKARGDERVLGTMARGWSRLDHEPTALRAQAFDLVLLRRLTEHNGTPELHDVFINRTGTKLGLQVRYRVLTPTSPRTVYLGGVRLPPEPITLDRYEPQAPSAVAVTSAAAVGLLPANDELWIQSRTFRDSLGVGLYDAQICIAPGDSVELSLHIIVTSPGSYEYWLDAARSLLGAAFTVDGGFAFVSYSMADWPTEKLRDWITMRHLHYVSAQPPTATGSTGLQGPALLQSPQALEQMRHFAAAVHRAAPDVKVLAYFHCYLVNSKAMQPAYENDRILGQSLKPVFYPRPFAPTEFQLCVPRLGSPFAADLERLLDRIWEFGYDGVYWDEMSYSFVPWTYGPNWDGVSGDVDPQLHVLLRTKGAVPLLAQPWIESVLEDLNRRGKVVVANTEPVSASMHRHHFPRFVETASTLALASTQLWSPIGLGDHLREQTSIDVAARIQAHLEHGALYYFYSPSVSIAAPNLTAYMFPVTPLRIRDGTILARERILTSRSGRFGWGDASQHEVHVFDPEGKEITPTARSVETGGSRWTDLQLRKGETAAIVRRLP